MTFLLTWLPFSVIGGVWAAYAISHRFLPSGWPKTVGFFTSAVLLTSGIFIGGLACVGGLAYSYAEQPFSSHQWQAEPNTRYTIVQDLLASGSLHKLNKAQTLSLLKEPDIGEATNAWTYELGQEPGFFSSSPAVLTLHFENGRIYRHELIRP
jgi:hypothetical protein